MEIESNQKKPLHLQASLLNFFPKGNSSPKTTFVPIVRTIPTQPSIKKKGEEGLESMKLQSIHQNKRRHY